MSRDWQALNVVSEPYDRLVYFYGIGNGHVIRLEITREVTIPTCSGVMWSLQNLEIVDADIVQKKMEAEY